MNNAWEVTPVDVSVVLNAHGIDHTAADADRLFDLLSTDDIENAALSYIEFDQQCNSALQEIETQLMDAGQVPVGPNKFVAEVVRTP